MGLHKDCVIWQEIPRIPARATEQQLSELAKLFGDVAIESILVEAQVAFQAFACFGAPELANGGHKSVA